MNNIKCFVSYCYDNIDRVSLDFFINKLQERIKYLTIYYDHKDDRIRNWNNYIKKIQEAQIIIVVCTPSYKKKVLDHSNGVYKEYIQIMERYIQTKKEAEIEAQNCDTNTILSKEDISNFDLIPIILQGNTTESIPKAFLDESINYHDFSTFRVFSSKENRKAITKISDSQSSQYILTVKKICARIDSVNNYLNGGFVEKLKEKWELLRIDELFKQTKANFLSKENLQENYHNSLFVKTYAYQQVATQSKYIFLGRKGSGKSALLQIASQKLSKKYSYIIPIERPNIDIFLAYNVFNEEISSDTNFLLKRITCFSFAWRLYIRLLLMESILIDYYTKNKSWKKSYPQVEEIESKLKPALELILNQTYNVENDNYLELANRNNYFIFSLSAVFEYLRKCINNARPHSNLFWADIESRFTYTNFLDNVFGTGISELVNSIIHYNQKNILITFDDADTYFDFSYSDSHDLEIKRRYELDLLYSLLKIAVDIKQLRKEESLASYFDFIITVSSDHFYEILALERDSYRLDEYYSIIFWTGVELAIMLRKRLEVAYNYKVDKLVKSKAKDTLIEILKKKLGILPQIVKFTLINGTKHELHIFLYILRFTFWRPRDILRYFAKIISHINDTHSNTIDSETIRLIVRKATHDIIEHEFINEYKLYITNIFEILNKFTECTQILTYTQINERIENCNFLYVIRQSKIVSTVSKIKQLYQIGFLGVYASQELQNMHNLRLDTAFIFNEGAEIINSLSEINKDKYQFTIHPIFQSFLQLKMDADRLLCHYTWEYLEEMEGLMMATNHSYYVKV